MNPQNQLSRIIQVRFRQSEYEYLKRRSEMKDASGRDYKSFSEFVREILLSENGYHSPFLKYQLADLRYEIHKIGVNINQVTKKINAGFGTQNDLAVLEKSLAELKEKFIEYEEKVSSYGNNKIDAHEGSQ